MTQQEIAALIARLVADGIQLWIEDGRLRFRTTRGPLDPEARATVSAHREAVLDVLAREYGGDTRVAAGSGHDGNAAAARHEPFPLTDIQQAYWIGRGTHYDLGNVSAYSYLELEAENLDLDRLAWAWNQLIARHDMLRAVVTSAQEQRVLAEVPPYTIDVLDLRDVPAAEAEERVRAERARMSHQVLSLDRWPLFEIRACRLGEGRTRLLVGLDLLIIDAQSFFQLLGEWAILYRDADALGPAPTYTFREYVLEERRQRDSEAYLAARDYWRGRLATLPRGPDFGVGTAAATTTTRFTRRTGMLDAARWQRLKERAGARGLTPSMVLCAAYARVLGAWAVNSRFCLNLTLMNRLPFHPEVDRIVGDFTSGILLEMDTAPRRGFGALAASLQEQLWKDMEHARVTSVEVLRELARAGERVTMPVVFTSMLDHARDGASPFSWLGALVHGISQTPQVCLDYQVYEDAGALRFNWDGVDERFHPGQLDAMFAAHVAYLERLADAGDGLWEQDDEVLLPADQRTLLAQVNATDGPVSPDTLHGLFARQAATRPEAPAVIAGDTVLGYADLARRADHLAGQLARAGAQRGELVAVCMAKGWQQVVAVLGILRAGAAYLPLDPELPEERRRLLLRDGRVRVAVTTPDLDDALGWPEDLVRLAVEDTLPPGEDTPALGADPAPEDLAYVIYTSGSTGQPKGVMIDHRGAVNTILDINERFGIGPEDRIFGVSSLSFDLSVYDVFGTLAAGATLVLPTGRPNDPEDWFQNMERAGVTVWSSVPALMEILLTYYEMRGRNQAPMPRLVLLSGDWIPVSMPPRIRALRHDAQVISLGGATEASIWSILYPIDKVDPAWASIPYGRPMRNQRFYVLSERLDPCPLGVTGELFIGGIGVALGYWGDEARTRERFIDHPVTGERLYRTGDLGRYLADGNIEFLGRKDHQVKIQGFRIECGEVEAALRGHEQVHEAVVLARDVGDRRKQLVAYVVPAGEAPPASSLRAHLEQTLPAYMVPSAFVCLDAFPLTGNGKVDRARLPAPRHDARSHGGDGAEAQAKPQGEIEPLVAELWARVLGIGAGAVARTDNFFELGGDSLKGLRLLGLIEEAFAIEIPVTRLLDAPTLVGVSAMIEQHLLDELEEA